MPIPLRTEEEVEMIKQYILLPLMLDVLESDRESLESVKLKASQVYGGIIRLLQAYTTAELAQVRRDIREHGMKVYEERRTELGIEARYLCRGYTYEFSLLWGVANAEIKQRFFNYLGIDVTKEGIL